MADPKVKEVSRVAIYQRDLHGKIHQLLVQRPEDSGRDPDRWSMFGGTNTFKLAESDQHLDPNAVQAALHIQNELSREVDAADLIAVDHIVTFEEKTGIRWEEFCYMLELAGEPLPTFIDHQPHNGVPRPIEWFEVEFSPTGEGYIFHSDQTSKEPPRPINGNNGEDGLTRDAIAFHQYLILAEVMNLLANQGDKS